MLGKLTDQQLKALRNLEGDENWEEVRKLLENSLRELHQDTDKQRDEIQLRWNQGASQVLRWLLSEAENASQTLRKRQSK